MNKFQKFSAAITAMVLVMAISFSSCKKEFDTPPVQTDPNIVANTTIATLKARHTVSGNYDQITDAAVISGVVIADDRSGNLYKEIYIQDSTGALQINLEESSIYGTFPVGRRVYIKCNGLYLSDYHGTPELGVRAVVNGVPSLNGIPSALIQNYVIGGSLNNPVVPKVVTLSQLGTGLQDPYLGNLIQLDGYEFQPSDTTNIYGDTSVYKNAGDLYIKNCSSTTLLDVRTSGYATFAGMRPPQGNGSILAIYTIYKSFPTSTPTKQFLIRDTSDVRFTGTRCGGSTGGGGGGGTGTLITLAQLRAMHPSTADVNIPSGNYIIAKVISNSSNESAGNYRLEDASGAGVLFYAPSGAPTYPLGTVLNIVLDGGKLALYPAGTGDLELSNTSLSGVTISSTAITITPVVQTVAQINASISTKSSTLVTINNVTISGGTVSGPGLNYTVTDATGSLPLFVRTASGIAVNTAGHTITGYLSIFSSAAQIGIRSATDIQ